VTGLIVMPIHLPPRVITPALMSGARKEEDPCQDQDRKQARSSAFGKRVRELRDRQEPSMEGGARGPRLTTIFRLADGLGVQPVSC
jgi:hypothetical protein